MIFLIDERFLKYIKKLWWKEVVKENSLGFWVGKINIV